MTSSTNFSGPVKVQGRYVATLSADGSSLVDAGGNRFFPTMQKTTAQPWKAAFWGDSRYNAITTTTPDMLVSGTGNSQYRSPTWVAAFMKDLEYTRNYAVSGDTAALWQSASRSGGKTFLDLVASDVDVVFIQYGVNDCIALTAAATTVANLQNLIAEIFKAGKLVVFESIMPVNTPASNYAAAQVLIDSVNSSMQAWLANFPNQAVYVDTATSLKAGGAYASATYMAAADGLHPTRAGAYLVGKLVAAAIRSFLPLREALFYGPASNAPNLCNLTSPSPITTQFNTMNTGTATVVQAQGQDASGYYYDFTVTPTALASGYNVAVLQLSANFQTSSPPYGALAGNEILQGSCRIVLDDGAGGAPNAYALGVRQRFYTASIYNEAITAPAAVPAALDAYFSEKVDVLVKTPKMSNTAASAVANPAVSAGYALQILVNTDVINVPYRVRVYNPQLRRVGFTGTPVAVTPPASTVAYTNTSGGPQQVVVGGGTVSAIAQNGVALGVTAGTFFLDPGETLTPTYTVAPTSFFVKQVLTQASMRALV